MEKVIATNIKSFSGLIAEMKQIVSRKAESTYAYSDFITDIQIMTESLEGPDEPYFKFYCIVRKNGTHVHYSEEGAKKYGIVVAKENEDPEFFRIECKSYEFSITELIF